MPLTFQPHSPKERPCLGIMKHTKPETQGSPNESVSGTVIVNEFKQTTPSVPTEVKDTKQESKLNELTKLVQMLINEKVNSDQKTQESNSKIQNPESSKSVDSSKISQDSKPKVQSTGLSKSLKPKPIQKPQLKCELCHYTNHSTDDCYRILYCMICKRKDHRTSDHEMYITSLKRSENHKAQLYQYASSSKQILRVKAKPFSPCTHCGFNDHMLDDCRNYTECEICRKALYTPPLTTMNLITSKERRIKEPIWYLDSGCSRSMTGVKSYLYKYVEQPGPKIVFGDNSSCITEGYGSINCGGDVGPHSHALQIHKWHLLVMENKFFRSPEVVIDGRASVDRRLAVALATRQSGSES
ncbi:hypothetical protein Tco_1263280 [Tanacetum coccineum]